MFDGLMTWDWDTNSAVPVCAAEAPTVSEDGLVYTFKLKEGMKFHNGDAVDAESFVRGWKRVASPKMETPSDICYHLAPVAGYAEFNAGDTDEFTGLKAVDELTFEVTLSAPMADFPAVCCHPGLVPVPQPPWTIRSPSSSSRSATAPSRWTSPGSTTSTSTS